MSKKISELIDASALDGTEQVELVQAGANVKTTINDLLPKQLQRDETIDLNGHSITFNNGLSLTFVGKVFSSTSEETGSNTSTATLDARNATGDGNNAGLFNSSSDVLATAQLQADYQDGTKDASISVQAQVSGSSITHTADTHTFNGDAIISNLAGGGTTGLSIDNDGKIIRTP